MKSLSTSCLLLFICVTAHQVSADPWGSGGCTEAEKMCGATYVTNPLANQWWRKLGPPSAPTAWTGPSDTVSGHPPATYQVLWRKGPPSGTPRDFQVLHALGNTFYFRAKTTPPADPSTFGYTQKDFATADRLATSFPDIAALYPEGATVKSCARDGFSHYLILGTKDADAFLVTTPATMAHVTRVPELKANVALLPVKLAGATFETIMDNLNYYAIGGQFEMAEFSASYYYLNRLPDSVVIHDLKTLGVTAPKTVCPEFPKLTAMGIVYPDSWNRAVGAPKD